MVTGTIRNAVNQKVMNFKWQQKKNEINSKKPISEMSKEERMLADLQEQANLQCESNKHADTYNKLKSGGKLTAEEIAYLEKNDPEALKKYREDQAEKAAYEKELKNCKTEEDVNRVRMNKLGDLAVRAKNITTNPYIPKDKKLELMNQLNNKLCLTNEVYHEFIKSKEYLDLPTEEELAESQADNIEEEPAENQADNIEAEPAENSEDTTTEEQIKNQENTILVELEQEINDFMKEYEPKHTKVDISI